MFASAVVAGTPFAPARAESFCFSAPPARGAGGGSRRRGAALSPRRLLTSLGRPLALTVVLGTALLTGTIARADPTSAEEELARARASLSEALEQLRSKRERSPEGADFTIDELRRTQEEIARARAAVAERLRELNDARPPASIPSPTAPDLQDAQTTRLLDPAPLGPAERFDEAPTAAAAPQSEGPVAIDLPPPPVPAAPAIPERDETSRTAGIREQSPTPPRREVEPTKAKPAAAEASKERDQAKAPGKPPARQSVAARDEPLPTRGQAPPARRSVEPTKAKPLTRDTSEERDQAKPQRKPPPKQSVAAREVPEAPAAERPRRPAPRAENRAESAAPDRDTEKTSTAPEPARKPRKEVAATASTKRNSRAPEQTVSRVAPPDSQPQIVVPPPQAESDGKAPDAVKMPIVVGVGWW